MTTEILLGKEDRPRKVVHHSCVGQHFNPQCHRMDPLPDVEGFHDPGGHSLGKQTKGICGPQHSGHNNPQDVN